jgi:uncharacterized caspase-like protein
MDVPEAARDAAAVAGVLADPRSCGYPPAQVTLLRDAQATREGVLAALDALAGRTTPEDTAVVFYCGHGAFGDDGHYSLTTHDTRVAAGRVAGGTGVSQQELLARVKALPVRRALLLFNACHAGALSPTLGPSEPLEAASLPADATEALLGTGEGRVIVTACREEQVSYIGEGPLSLFTGALVDALGGKGVPNRTGYISAFDLYTAVYDAVSETVRTRYGEQQEPELTVQKGVGPMAVALYRGATATGTFEAPVEPEARPAVRTVASERAVRQFQVLMTGARQVGDRTEVHTGGGAHVGGGVTTGGGAFVGRDQLVHGDQVRGDQVGGDQIRVGDISGGRGIAIGRGAQASVHEGDTGPDLGALFARIYREIEGRAADPEVEKEELKEVVQKVEEEAKRGEQASPGRLERLLKTLGLMAPDVLEVTLACLTSPAAGIAAALKKVAEKVGGKASTA